MVDTAFPGFNIKRPEQFKFYLVVGLVNGTVIPCNTLHPDLSQQFVSFLDVKRELIGLTVTGERAG